MQSSKWVCIYNILKCIWILNSFLEFKFEGWLGAMRLYWQIQGKKILKSYIIFFSDWVNVLADKKFICHSYHSSRNSTFSVFSSWKIWPYWPQFIGSLEILQFYQKLCVYASFSNLAWNNLYKNFKVINLHFQKLNSFNSGLGFHIFPLQFSAIFIVSVSR